MASGQEDKQQEEEASKLAGPECISSLKQVYAHAISKNASNEDPY